MVLTSIDSVPAEDRAADIVIGHSASFRAEIPSTIVVILPIHVSGDGDTIREIGIEMFDARFAPLV